MNCLLMLCLCAVEPNVVAAPTPSAAAALVRRLGEPAYLDRERASAELLALGRAAVPELKRGLQDGDAEVRRRCADLLEIVDRSDLDVRLDAFVEGRNDPKAPLPGWALFRQLTSDDRLARTAFAELHRHDAALLQAVEKDPKQIQGLLNSRCQKLQRLYGWNRPVDRGAPFGAEISAMVFLAAALPPGDNNAFYQFSNCCYLPGVRAHVHDNPVVRRLVGHALMRRENDPNMLSQAAYLANHLGLTELQEKLRPAVLRMTDEAIQKPNEPHRLSEAANLAALLNMKELMEEKLKPAVRKAAEGVVARNDRNQLQQLYYTAQSLGMEDLLKDVLRPAARKAVRQVAAEATQAVREKPDPTPATTGVPRRPRRVDPENQAANKIYEAYNLAQSFQMNDLMESVVKPAAFVVIEEMGLEPESSDGKFDQAVQLAANLALDQALQELIRPSAERVLAMSAAKPTDQALFNRAVYLAQCLEMRDAVEKHLRPALEKRAKEAAAKPNDLAGIHQVFQQAQSLGLSGPIQDVLKPTVLKALESQKTKPVEPGTAQQLLHLVRGMKLKEGADAALKTAENTKVDAYTRGLAVATLAEMGGKEHIGRLEGLLKDTTRLGQCGVNSSTLTCDLRDVALAAIITLNGSQPADFDFLYPAVTSQPLTGDSFSCFGFEDDASRAAALKKWQASRK
jgi:hypothetical protein